MDIFSVQLIVLVCLWIGSILCGSLPSVLRKLVGLFNSSDDVWNRKARLSSFLLYVGAGIFISDSFLVLLPQTNQEFMKSYNYSHEQKRNSTHVAKEEHVESHHGFPIPEFVILCGFFVAFVIQEVIFLLLTKCNGAPREFQDAEIIYCTCAKRHTECSRTYKYTEPGETLFGLEKETVESVCAPNPGSVDMNVAPPSEATAESELLQSSIRTQAVPNYGTVTNATDPSNESPLPGLSSPVLLASERRIVLEEHDKTRYQNKFLINSMLIVLALTLQCIFLGIQLGLCTEHFQQWQYLLLVCLQNCALIFSAGSYLAGRNIELSYITLFVGLLSAISPTGMIAAMLKKNALQKLPHLAKAISFAVSCGTLMFTTFYEMLRQKNQESVTGLTKFLAILSGAGVMYSLQYFISIL